MRTRTLLLHAILLTLASLPSLYAQAGEHGYVSAEDGRCSVWAPSRLKPEEYALRYTGGCKNGRAEGKGKAEWLYRYAEMKVKSRWEGEFRNGVFLNGSDIKGSITPIPGDQYLIPMGKVNGADLLFISSSEQDGPLELCRTKSIRLVLPAGVSAADEDRVKSLMLEAHQRYRKTCPDTGRDLNLGVHTEAVLPQPNHMLPNPIAQAYMGPAATQVERYSNKAAEQARQEQARAEHERQREASRLQFHDFSRRNNIQAWVTLQQLDENPFRWEGQTVGVVVRLERMLTRDRALIRSALRDRFAPVQLTGVTPNFPSSQNSVLLAATVGKREPLPDSGDKNPTLATLHHLASRTCDNPHCDDWLMWARSDQDIPWGEPFKAR